MKKILLLPVLLTLPALLRAQAPAPQAAADSLPAGTPYTNYTDLARTSAET